MTAQPKVQETDDLFLPSGFIMKEDGIYYVKEDRDGFLNHVWLCSPMRVLALPRDRNNTGWGRLVEVMDPDGRVHRWSIPARMFAGDGTELRAGLLDLGLNMASDRAARQALNDLLQRWQPPDRVITAERLGWCDGSCDASCWGTATCSVLRRSYINAKAPPVPRPR